MPAPRPSRSATPGSSPRRRSPTSPAAIAVDGVKQSAPYTVLAIGDSQTMSTALEIPGGVIASLPKAGQGHGRGEGRRPDHRVAAGPTRRYAQPAETADSQQVIGT